MDKMNSKQRKEWLAGLKTGDLVTIESGPYAGTIYKIVRNECGNLEVLLRELTITGILPKGIRDYTTGKIVPATDEQIANYMASSARSKISYGVRWGTVTDEQVLAIAKILNLDLMK